MSYRTKNRWCSVDAYFQNGAVGMSLSPLRWNRANTSFMIVAIQSPPPLPMIQEQQSLIRHRLSCSGWGMERVSVVLSFTGRRFTQNGQWSTKVNIVRFAVGYLNASINRKTRNTEPEIGINGSGQTMQDLQVDRYGSGFAPPVPSGSRPWTDLEPHRTILRSKPRPLAGYPNPLLTLSGA